ncbi:MAG TPA: DUF5330 domain-containing protein [Pseudolabrys sp.]|nr:DUF5330 domain-containing protein [Pseudolabrys sp.]
MPRGALKRVKLKGYRRGNHAWSAGAARRGHYAPTSKILIEFDIVEFDENSRRFCPKTSLQCERQLQPCLVRFGLKAAEKSSGIMGRVMFFLLRMAFWLGVVCVLLPSGAKPTSAEANIDAKQAMTLAGAAMTDMRGFCERQPDACVAGGKVAVAIGHKAEAGARTIYEFITTKLNEKSAPAEKTATKEAPAPGQGTLTSTDVQPAWHAPVPLPPRREARAARPSV